MGEFTHAMRNPIRERDNHIAALEELLCEVAPDRNHDIECGLDGYDGDCLRCRIDAALPKPKTPGAFP
jgi:hypothetical protein